MGCDRGVHVQCDQDTLDALTPLQGEFFRNFSFFEKIEKFKKWKYYLVSKIMAKVVQEEGTDLVIVGKQSIDSDYGQTAAMLAGQLDWPQATQLFSVRNKKGF